nr:ADP-ribosyl cyclase/cyclic ADP-ribose hydrolase 1-like isoform X2 [Nerophis lumbriciformis]
MISMTARLLVLSMCLGPLLAHFGTTPNIKHIVIGRCFNYITLVNPSVRYDCEEIWQQFEEAVVQQASCGVAVEDYRHMFQAMPQTWACDRFLFWSKTRALIHDYAAVVRRFWTLEDTLVGYMFNDLIWCGQQEDSDFDFGSCPQWSACLDHPVHSLWRQASKDFAETACGNITVLLNGSIDDAFNKNRSNYVWKCGAGWSESTQGELCQHQSGDQPGWTIHRILSSGFRCGPDPHPPVQRFPLDLLRQRPDPDDPAVRPEPGTPVLQDMCRQLVARKDRVHRELRTTFLLLSEPQPFECVQERLHTSFLCCWDVITTLMDYAKTDQFPKSSSHVYCLILYFLT